MVNLWDIPTVGTSANTTDNIKGILEEQAKYLESGTNGKVMADLSEIDDIPTDILSPSGAFSLASSYKGKDKDANDLYKPQFYGFDIHNDFYRFRIFEINLFPLYPVSMFFDEGVLEDTEAKFHQHSIKKGKLANQYVIQSDEDFINSLSAVLASKKVKFIIGKLQQM